jgi:hypothetical protein
VTRRLILATAVCLAACGGGKDGGGITTPPSKKPDPFTTIRVRNMLDTTTAAGRSHWHVYTILTGSVDQNGVSFAGSGSLQDLRTAHSTFCINIEADSIGTRMVSILAIADTTTSSLTPDAQFDPIAQAWFNGVHALPAGYMAIVSAPADPINSLQYLVGHGLTNSDPIRWGMDWTGPSAIILYERADADPLCNRAF